VFVVVEMVNVVETIQSFMVLETQIVVPTLAMVVLDFQAMGPIVH
jgi:hypothetical protein